MPLSRPRPDAQREPATRSTWWIDLLIVISLAALVAGVVALARRWSAPLLPTVEIDLSLWSLPGYTLLSLARGVAAYILSLVLHAHLRQRRGAPPRRRAGDDPGARHPPGHPGARLPARPRARHGGAVPALRTSASSSPAWS
jgi:hypothetical protein